MNFNTCIDSCNYLHGQDIEPSHHPPSKKDSLLSSLYSHLLPVPENHLSFFFFTVCLWESHINGILQHVTSWDKLFSISTMPGWFIQLVRVSVLPFYLLLSSIPWYEWVIIINLLKIHYIFNWSLIHIQ